MKELSKSMQQEITGGGALVYIISLLCVVTGRYLSILMHHRYSITR